MTRLLPFLLPALLLVVPAARGDDTLEEARAIQSRVRVTVAKVRPAVVAVQTTGPRGADRASRGGSGSGVVISPSGEVLTNWHVVRGATRIVAIFAGNRRVTATVLGRDPEGDLALLTLEGEEKRPWVTLGTDDDLEPGRWVLAMGNPRGFAVDGRATVTWGIVTALHNLGGGDTDRTLFYGDAIQTDAEINPGNSGGPLFDLDGRLVGINGRIATRDRVDSGAVNANVGFAIPVSQIRRFLPRLRKGGEVRHGWLGVRAGREPGEGVEAAFVAPDSPAARAGVRAGDRLLAIDGEPVAGAVRLTNLVSSRPAGERIALRVRRGEAVRIVVLTLAARPETAR